MKTINKQPKIRFKGYTDEWQQRKLGELAESFEYGLNAPSKEYDGENKYLRITDIDESSRQFKTESLTSPNIDLELADNYILKKGDILFARTGASVGKTYRYNERDGVVYYAGFLIRARIKTDVNAEFIFQNTLTENYNNYIKVTSQRSGQPGVNAFEYSKFELMMPKQKEQQKIGNFFKQLDDTIALHQRQLEALEKTKKSFLQKMFPKKDKTKPEIRFSGFTDDWEQRKFRDFTKISQGLQIAISNRFTVPGKNRLFYITNEFLNPNSAKAYYIEDAPKSVIASQTDILMTRTGNTGKIVTGVEGAFHNNFFKISYDENEVSHLFLFHLLNSDYVQNEIRIGAGSSTIPDLKHPNFYKINVEIPKFDEQQKIGNFFKQLDDTIALHQRQLEVLKNMKTSFLQKMYI
ncbi:restriction endonuclease subunit S [Vagococcus lutrae]|uniref:restriction endonuclease subunit S n=1 Tax=Vagococcus lutrae TaxID=81947 RepID=UPI0028923E9D|nr:restriction endonuclease subunit S [Vagococcus lutrae]MDT2826630.1 restriction endonuclease subunit S [Vagococcus lutrae]MDT2842847.1 restriction endonuclease subunit S [Vagococcus lutrae]